MRSFLEKIFQLSVYLQGMEQRAKRRRSLWNLLLALVAIILIPFVWFILLQTVLAVGHLFAGFSNDIDERSNLASILLNLPLFFVSLPIALLAVNWLVKFIPRAAEVFDREAEGDDLAKVEGRIGPKYAEAQAGLKTAVAVVCPLALISLFAALFVS